MSKRILLSAFACDPAMGSEPYVGWNWLRQLLAAYPGPLLLLTRQQHAAPVRAALPAEEAARLEVLAFDLPGFAGLDHRHRLMKLYYVVWQCAALLVVLWRQGRRQDISLIHHCTYNVVDMPGLLWLVPGAAFLWGPIGGGQVPPAWAAPIYGRGWARERRRRRMKRLIRYNPLVLLAAWRARAILVANEDTLAVLPRFAQAKSVRLLETAVSTTGTLRPRGQGDRFRLLWVGQLEPRKGLVLLLQALRTLREKAPTLFARLELAVVGSGPEQAAMQQAVADWALAGQVRLIGALDYQAVQALYARADLFVFTSVQDTSGNVLLEALSNGLPALAFDHQGAREILAGGGGRRLPADSLEQAVEGLASAITELADAPAQLQAYAEAAIDNVNQRFLWEQKGVVLRRVLDEILQDPESLEFLS